MGFLSDLTNLFMPKETKAAQTTTAPKTTTPKTTTQAPTAYQSNVSTPVPEKKKTSRDILANILTVGEKDPEKAKLMYEGFQYLQSDPTSSYFNPYSTATNRSVNTLAEYGIDASVMDDDWFANNTGWKDYLVYNGTTNTPSSPGTKASAEQKAAYEIFQIGKSVSTTNAVDSEWAALQEELAYWANRTDLNLSDDQIIERINKQKEKKYPTLYKMDQSLKDPDGVILELNHGTDYSEDNMYGVIWAARNGGSTGSIAGDTAMSGAGYGVQWQDDPEKRAKLDDTNPETYSPFSVSSTMYDACLYFGLPSFDDKKIDELGRTIDRNDATAVKFYNQIVDAENFTKGAEEELDEMNNWLDTKLSSATDPNKVMGEFEKRLNSKWSHLKKMDDSMEKIDSLVDTTRAIDYCYNDVKRRVEAACEENRNRLDTNATLEKYGVKSGTDQGDAVSKAETEKVNDVALTMGESLGESERNEFTYAPSLNIWNIGNALLNLVVPYFAERENQFQVETTRDYVNSTATLYADVAKNEQAQSELESTKLVWTVLSNKKEKSDETGLSMEQYSRLKEVYNSEDWNRISKILMQPDVPAEVDPYYKEKYNSIAYSLYNMVNPGSEGYSDTDAIIEQAVRYVEIANNTADVEAMTADEIERYNAYSEYRAEREQVLADTAEATSQLEYQQKLMHEQIASRQNMGYDTHELEIADAVSRSIAYFANYEATQWSSYNKYDLMAQALGEGVAFEEIQAAAASGSKQVADELEDVKWLKQYIVDNGIEVPDNYMKNLDRYIAKLERDQTDYKYFSMQGEADFDEFVAKGMEMEANSRGVDHVNLMHPAEWMEPIIDLMQDSEKATYYYLIGKYGAENPSEGYKAAAEYWNYLIDPEYGVIGSRQNEAAEAYARQLVNSGFGGAAVANVMAVLSAPLEAIGGLTTILASTIGGMEYNPDSPTLAFGKFSQTVNEETARNIKEGIAEGPLRDIAMGMYEILYNRGRSMTNAFLTGGLSIGGKFGDILTELAGAAPMAIGAASMAIADAKEKGVDDATAYLIGGVTLAMEDLTEGLTRSNIRKAFAGGEDAALTTIKDRVADWLTSSGLEEAFGETLTDYVEQYVDKNYMGEFSDHNALVSRIMEENMLDPNDPVHIQRAEDMARAEEIANLVHTAIISFMSPGLDVVGSTAKEALTDYHNIRSYQRQNKGTTFSEARKEYMAWKEESRKQAAQEASSEVAEQSVPQQQAPQAETQQTAQGRQMSNDDETFIHDLEMLETVSESDVSTQTAALEAVFGGEQGTNNADASHAAAVSLPNLFSGLENAISAVKNIIGGAKIGKISLANVKTALQMAVLSPSSQAAQVANTEEFQIASPEEQAQMLAGTVEADMQDANVLSEVEQSVKESRIAEKEKVLIAQGAYDELNDKRLYYEGEQYSLSVAEKDLQEHTREEEIKVNAALNDATNAANELAMNPTDENRNWVDRAMGAFNKATEVMESVVKQWQDHYDNVARSVQEAKEKYETALRDKQAVVRQQAEQMVVEEDQQRAELAAQQAEQARIQAEQEEQARLAQEEQNNFARAQADAIIAENYANATDEQKQKIRDVVKKISTEKQMTETEKVLARADYVKRIGKKFGYDIRIGDTTEGGRFLFQNASVNPETGTITLSREATLSDAMYAILGHEVTHIAERAGKQVYDELANALIKLEYGDDTERMQADIDARQELYRRGLQKLMEQGKNVDPSKVNAEYAKQELVADLMGKLFLDENGNANVEMLNRFAAESPNVAKRVLNAIKSFLKKLAGIEGAPLTEAQKIVDTLEAALKKVPMNTSNQRYSLDPGEANAIRISNGTMKETGEDVNFIDLILDGKKLGETRDYNPNNRSRITRNQWLGLENDDGMVVGRVRFGDPILITKDSPEYESAYIAGTNYDIEDGGQKLYYPVLEKEDFRDNPIPTHRYGSLYHQYMAKPIAKDDNGNSIAAELPGGTVVVSPGERFSLNSFNDEEKARVRQALYSAKNPDGSNRFTREQVDKYIEETTGIASLIASDKARWDFIASDNQVFLKKNTDYYFTLDASTLCAKRLLYQGTFDYVQHALPDEVFTPEDLIDLVNIMADMGYETPCGICYVESRRRWLDTYANEFLDNLPSTADEFIDKYFKKATDKEKTAIRDSFTEEKPSIDDLTTSDGLEKLRHDNPYMYKAFVDAMNGKGSANPKVVQLRTEYRGDIGKMSASDIQKVKDIGGLRIQSFSDFETPHLLDMMQAVLDMSAVGLTSQAYTKVPNFAWVFGDTGIKINLSLIGKGTGLDENGNLVFDNREGINFDEAMKLRERYNANVGTILVGINDEHIIAAMGDPRIDFIIPFHKSGWSSEELRKMPTLNNYKDYTSTQNERYIVERVNKVLKEWKTKNDAALQKWIEENGENYVGYRVESTEKGYKIVFDGYKTESFQKHKERTGEKLSNLEPVGANQYWDFKKSGQWNAENYLKMCAEQHRMPKFWQFLVDNGDGSFSLPNGNDKRSISIREGYWKTLIDFKMYENDSYGRTKEDGTKTNVKGSEQKEVTPNINMAEAYRVMNDYQLGRQMPDQADGTKGKFIPMESNNSVPVAVPAGDAYIEMIRQKRAGNKPVAPGPDTLEADLPVNPKASAFGASPQAPAVLGNTEGTTEESVQANASQMAIDAETGETVRYSLPTQEEIDRVFDEYISGLSLEELEELALKDFGISLKSPSERSMNAAVKETAQDTADELQGDLHELYDNAIKSGDMSAARTIIDKIAKAAGFTVKGTHRTNAKFTVFDKSKQSGKNGKSLGDGFYVAAGEGTEYDDKSYGKNRMLVYVNPGNVFNMGEGLTEEQAQAVYDKYFAPYHPNAWEGYTSHVLEKLQSFTGVIDYIKEAAKNAGTTTDEVFKWLGYNSIKDGPQYCVFDPEQIKSADLVTYDDSGNAIDSTNRFNMGNPDIRYSLPSDAPYLSAVDHGDMSEAQRLVDERTGEAGYVIDGYHGTVNGGYTIFDKQKAHIGGNSGAGFYFSSNRADSEANYADIEGADNHFKVEHLVEKIQEYISESGENEYAGVSIPEDASYEDLQEIAKKMLQGNPQTYHVRLNPGKAYIRDGNNSTNLIEDVINNFDESLYSRDDYDSEDDYYDSISMARSDEIYEAISNAVYNGIADVDSNFEIISNVDYDKIISDLAMVAIDYEKLTMADLIDMIGRQEIDAIVGDGEEAADATIEIARAIVEAFGFDSIEDREVGWKFNQLKNMKNLGGGDTVHYIMFHPNQIKLADPVTYDNEGNVIPLSERFKKSNNDIRYSLPSDNLLEQQLRYQMQNRQLTQEDIDAYQQKTSRPLEGKSDKWSQTAGPAQRQFATGMLQESDEIAQQAKDYALAHSAMFPDTNAAQIERAINWIRKNGSRRNDDGSYTQATDGFSESLEKATSKSFDYRSADGQARMVAMMGMAVAKNDTMAQVALVDAFNRQGTDLGRALQSRKLFRLMAPEGRISTLQKMLQNTQDEINAKGSNLDLKFSDWIYQAAAVATEEGDFQKVQQAAAIELAEQLPANWKDRIRSLRMLSMLANPRTHIRNIIGNAFFIPAVGLKNKLGAIAELGLKQGEKTKTLAPFLSKEARRFAKEDALAMKDTLTGEAKYNEDSMVQRAQKPFKGLLQALSDFNSNALEAEDWHFLKNHYKRALGSWMMANGYTAAQLESNPSLLEQGRAYAVQEAQKATYRDFNKLAQTLNRVSREGGVGGFLVDAVLPFKKTPANILRRGLEYSPAGLMRSLTTDLYHLKQWNDYKKGKLNALPDKAISPSQFIDRLCSGLSGTAILAVGALLSSAGIVSVGLDDDDDELEKAKGNQKYALKFNIGGQDFTYTMDWAAPMSMPFFVGAAIQEQLAKEGDFDVEELVNAFGNITEPVFNLSMLDGVNTLFKTSQYDDTNTLTQIGAKVLSNYATSYVPSILGAIARTIDPNSRKAFVESGKGNGVLGTFRYAREQTENKIPFLNQTNIPVRDVWGNAQTSSLAERLIENFISPGYISEYKDDPILNEIGRLYDLNAADAGTLVPSDPPKSVTYKKEKYVLTAEQWDHYKEVRGQTAYEVLNDLVHTEDYQNAAASVQAQMIKDAWSYADAIGKSTFIPDYEIPKMGDNPEQTIAKDATIAGYKSEMIKALDDGEWETYETMVEALKQADVEDSTIKTKIGDTYRDQWKAAYRKGDEEKKMAEIEEILDNTGFDFNIYGKNGWMDKVDQEMEEDGNKSGISPDNIIASTASLPSRRKSISYDDQIGQYGRGNIDLNNRQVVWNPDGSFSTEQSFSFYDEETGKEVLIPTVINGRIVSEDEAIDHYYKTGEYLGMFDTPEEADEYAEQLHQRQEWYYNR